jgi:PAS domain S-box-containing protein
MDDPLAKKPAMPEPDARLLSAILEQAADAVIFADTAGVVRIWNQAATALFGYSEQEIAGAGMDVIIPEKLRAAHWAGFRRAMETGRTRLAGRPTITRATHKSGARMYVEMSFAAVRAGDGTMLGAVAVARDATDRYERERGQQ